MRYVACSGVVSDDLHVTRYRVDPDEDMVEIWGHVGDYEVCVYLPLAEARRRGLVVEEGPGPDGRARKTNRG